jgi:hypothetical protein
MAAEKFTKKDSRNGGRAFRVDESPGRRNAIFPSRSYATSVFSSSVGQAVPPAILSSSISDF